MLPKEARDEANESELELTLFNTMVYFAKDRGLELPERQVAFDGTKRRIDIALSKVKVGVEVQGGTYGASKGAHSRPIGQSRDFKKLNDMAMAGWLPLQFDAVDIERRNVMQTVQTIYAAAAAVEIRKAAK
jgi:hypothetical protein